MSDILEIEITLKGSKPKIWRRVLVSSDSLFHELHYIIQFAMGWTNSHLHQFITGKNDIYIGIPSEDDWIELEDSRIIKLSEYLSRPKDKMVYEYDFGDSWQHEVVVKKVLAKETSRFYPVCTDGKGACPPEDVGGVWGYADLLEKLKKTGTDEYEEILEWLGNDFSPEKFDLEGTNRKYFKNFKKEMKTWDKMAYGDI